MSRDYSDHTVHPTDMSTGGLCETFLLYNELQSRSVRDEMYLSMLEDEIERRRQFSFNRAIIEQFLPS